MVSTLRGCNDYKDSNLKYPNTERVAYISPRWGWTVFVDVFYNLFIPSGFVHCYVFFST